LANHTKLKKGLASIRGLNGIGWSSEEKEQMQTNRKRPNNPVLRGEDGKGTILSRLTVGREEQNKRMVVFPFLSNKACSRVVFKENFRLSNGGLRVR